MMVLHILWNRLQILLRDKSFLVAMVVVPILLSAISGAAMKRELASGISLALVAADESSIALDFSERIKALAGIHVQHTDMLSAEKLLDMGKVDAVLSIPQYMTQQISTGKYDGLVQLRVSPYSMSGSYLKERIATEMIRMVTPEFLKRWLSGKPHITSNDEALSMAWQEALQKNKILMLEYEELPVSSTVVATTVRVSPAEAGSNGLLVLFMMFSVLYGSSWLSEERRNGTLARVTASGVSLGKVVFGNAAALFVGGVVSTLIYRLSAALLFGFPVFRNPAEALLLAAYLLAAVGLGMILAAIFPQGSALQSAAPVIALLTGFVGGCLWNRLGPGGQMQTLSLITPQGWALLGMNQLSADMPSIGALLPMLVLSLFGMFCLVLSNLLLKKQRF